MVAETTFETISPCQLLSKVSSAVGTYSVLVLVEADIVAGVAASGSVVEVLHFILLAYDRTSTTVPIPSCSNSSNNNHPPFTSPGLGLLSDWMVG